MQIGGSLLSNALATYQAGQRRVDGAGAAIASQAVVPANSQAQSDAAEAVVQMTVGETTAKAGTRLIQTADEVLGTLIDTRA